MLREASPAGDIAGDLAGELARSRLQSRSLLLIPRELDVSIAERLDAAVMPAPTRLRLTGDAATLLRAVADAAASLDLEPSLAAWLAADVGALMRLYRQATRAAHLAVRIETVVDDACRQFHTDNVHFRLATTYRGPGTQWLDPGAAARSILPNAPGAGDSAPAPEAIRAMARGWIAVMRGGKAATADLPALPHRSPPIAGTGVTRLFVAIDAALDRAN
jgi:hypothetical protein